MQRHRWIRLWIVSITLVLLAVAPRQSSDQGIRRKVAIAHRLQEMVLVELVVEVGVAAVEEVEGLDAVRLVHLEVEADGVDHFLSGPCESLNPSRRALPG